jgi:squalene-hopene/tetraprenyl-beta-curcumene cyclase
MIALGTWERRKPMRRRPGSTLLVALLVAGSFVPGCRRAEAPPADPATEAPPAAPATEAPPAAPDAVPAVLGTSSPPSAPSEGQAIVARQTGERLIDISLEKEARAAVDRALDGLAAGQKPDGSWSNGDFPALTGLPLWAFALSDHKDREAVVQKAVKFLLGCVREDGGIYRQVPGKGGGLSNYNTALCMVALHALNDPALTPVVLRARRFVAAGQHFGGDMYEGGMGYDRETGRAYTDLSDSVIAFEAMRLTQSVEDQRDASAKPVDLDWEAAKRFLDRVQNKPAAGSNEAGGFFYRPDESKAGTVTNEQGVVVFRSFGSMTYAGLLSLIYADVSKTDPRVKSAFDWSVRHWSLDENPGMGEQGLFYFYNVLTKALSAYGRDEIPRAGRSVYWRPELVKKLLSLQKIDPKTGHGYWVNANGRFWESDPVLVTAYSVIALQVALGR